MTIGVRTMPSRSIIGVLNSKVGWGYYLACVDSRSAARILGASAWNGTGLNLTISYSCFDSINKPSTVGPLALWLISARTSAFFNASISQGARLLIFKLDFRGQNCSRRRRRHCKRTYFSTWFKAMMSDTWMFVERALLPRWILSWFITVAERPNGV